MLRWGLLLLLVAGCSTTTAPKRAMLRTAAPPPPGSVVLEIGLTNLVDQAMVSWVAAAPTDAGGGSGTINIVCYTGPGVTLTAVGLTTNGCFIETSTNLVNWLPYPTNGFQLTLLATNASTALVLDQPQLFFRGRIGPVNQ